MSRARDLTDLILDVRLRTNMESSTFVTDAEITEWLNQALAELHAILVTVEGHPHFRSQTNINVVSGTELYPLPFDFYRLQRLTGNLDGYIMDLEPYMESERAALLNSTIYSFAARGCQPLYRIDGGYISILPATRTYTATMFYTATSPRLVAGGDTVDGFDGYEMAAIYDACASVRRKEESDESSFLGERDRILNHVRAMAAHRDMSHPERVSDVTGGLDNTLMPWLYR